LTTGSVWPSGAGISTSPSINSVALGTNDPWNTTNANSVLIGVGSIWNTETTPYTLTLIVSPPTLLLTAPSSTLTSNCSGVPSSPTTFGINGSGLFSDVLVSAPSGFEISNISNESYGSSLTLSPDVSNTISSTIFIRLSSNATNSVSGTITAYSTTDGSSISSSTTVSSTTLSSPSFNVSSYTICKESSYLISLTIDENSVINSNGWSTSSNAISVNGSGYVTAGTVTGTYSVSYSDACAQTVSANVTVSSTSTLPAITDGLASYKFNNNPQGPLGSGDVIYMGYNGFNYYSATKPTKPGFYRANNVSGNSAGCPYAFYIFRCTTCPD
jgi:hypothetical protein